VGKGSADETILFINNWGRTYGIRNSMYTATGACDKVDATIAGLKDKLIAGVSGIDSGEIQNGAYVTQYICSVNSIAYKPGEVSRQGMTSLYDTIITGKLLASLFTTRLRDAGRVREALTLDNEAQSCTAFFLDNMMRTTQAACYSPAALRTRDQRLMDRLSQAVDVLGQSMAMNIIPGGDLVTLSAQYFQVTATSGRKVDTTEQGVLGNRTNDIIGFVSQADTTAQPHFSYRMDIAPTCIGLSGWACAKDVTTSDVLRVSSYFFTRATFVEGGTDYINPLPRAAYSDPRVFGGLAGVTATYVNRTGFDVQLARISSNGVILDLVRDIQSGIRTHTLWVERFLYASRLPLSAQTLDFLDYALPVGFDDAEYQRGVRYWPLGTDLVGDVPEFALISRNWTRQGIVVQDSAQVRVSAADLYYARVIAPYVEERVFLPPPPFEFLPPPPSPPMSPPPPPIEVQFVRGDLDPALVVAPIVAGMALCAYLMHVYTKRRRDMQNIHIDLDDEIEYDPADDDEIERTGTGSEYESMSEFGESDDDDDDDESDESDGSEDDDRSPQGQIDVVDRSVYAAQAASSQQLPEPERPSQRGGLFGRLFRGGASRKQRYEIESTNPPMGSRGGRAGPSNEAPMLEDDGGGVEDDRGQRL